MKINVTKLLGGMKRDHLLIVAGDIFINRGES